MVSVIIPSLGGDLSKTLNSLNSGTVKPDEIIICLPNDRHSINNLDKYRNITVIYSNKYGQVFQRICGFKAARNDLILQIDDDVIVSINCLKLLVDTMKNSKEKISVSPCWYNSSDKFPLHQKKQKNIVMLFYYWIINGSKGYVSGELSLAGTNFGVNPLDISEDLFCVDWQPGGCVLHDKNNIIFDDYYPYTGKAFYEDLMHSFLLRKSSVGLVVNMRATCMTDITPRVSLGKDIYLDIRARKYFVKLANLSVIRMYIFYVIYILRSILLSITR
ncbi:MAG TPA: glycosyltransferase family 2 protein [Rhodospirillales bacterium]|nr:glycosyltransferase family 2 protein [Rhodospirillales bacterium]